MPSVAREAAAVWSEKVSKVQFQMMRIDGDGTTDGACVPHLHPGADAGFDPGVGYGDISLPDAAGVR